MCGVTGFFRLHEKATNQSIEMLSFCGVIEYLSFVVVYLLISV